MDSRRRTHRLPGAISPHFLAIGRLHAVDVEVLGADDDEIAPGRGHAAYAALGGTLPLQLPRPRLQGIQEVAIRSAVDAAVGDHRPWAHLGPSLGLTVQPLASQSAQS